MCKIYNLCKVTLNGLDMHKSPIRYYNGVNKKITTLTDKEIYNLDNFGVHTLGVNEYRLVLYINMNFKPPNDTGYNIFNRIFKFIRDDKINKLFK